MRIAILNKYQNKVFRGAETFVYELGKKLSKDNEVDIIADVNYLSFFRKRYDVIIPTNGRYQAVLVRLISWMTGSKMVVSGQSGMGWDDKVNLYSFPDAFVALSQKALSWAKKVNSWVKCVYIPNGVDLNKFKPGGSVYKTGFKKPVILCGGAFTPQKRMDLSIKAVAKIPEASLLMVGGGGELKNELKRFGEKILGKDRFKLLTVPFEKMPEVYRAADVFTLPSKSSESFGNVLVEAMATDLPVVATNDPVRANIVGDAGILVNPENTEDYAAALAEALKKNWRNKPREQSKKFSWDIVAEKYINLFKTL